MEIQRVKFEKLAYNFDESWHSALKNYIESEDCYKVLSFLTKENKEGKQVLPSKQYLWRCFQETKLNEMHTVWLALSPYPQLNTGDGLCFSNSLTSSESPSLRIILDACEDDLGYKGERNRDLKRWANQGVLMLNCALSCQVGLPESHLKIWENFIKFLYSDVFNDKKLNFVYFGAKSREFQVYENKELHKSLAVEHPSYSARQERPMIHKNLFSWVNTQLKNCGKSEIKWMEFSDLPWKEVEQEDHFLM